jgi:uncharacterized protein
MLLVDIETARRFILGKQGLWPGRRWRGLKGTEQAMRAMEYLQLDPLQMIARSQDISLYSRVLNYKPELWENAAYKQRKFFDWGGWLAARPMEELPYWRVVMHRERDGGYGDPRLRQMAKEHAKAIVEVRAILKDRETVGNRDFEKADRKATQSYRGRKDSALALYYLWRIGDVMTHHRERFERVYALTENVAPKDLIYEKTQDEADRFLVRKEISFGGMARIQRTGDSYGRGEPDLAAKKLLEGMLADGEIIEVKVDGMKAVQYALADDEKIISELSAGRIPKAWKPVDTTTAEETVFLAPLDHVSARGRAKDLFGFDYVWEVYKPEHQRKFGYYVLPVLWGDRLVARFDSKLDRTTNTFIILGFWLEDKTLAKNESFAEALGRGFARFVNFLGAEKMDTKAISYTLLRKTTASFL